MVKTGTPDPAALVLYWGVAGDGMTLKVDLRDGQEISDYWRLCEVLTIQQAALLIVGSDPASEISYCEGWKIQERPTGYEAVKQALTSALKKSTIIGEIRELIDMDKDRNFTTPIRGTVDITRSTVERNSLMGWLQSRGLQKGFFFPVITDEPDYLNPMNPRYAPKLAATVRAWQAVTDPKGKSPKQALTKWLREHAAEFGQSDDDGVPINQAMEECSAVANWQPKGGAAKTPGG